MTQRFGKALVEVGRSIGSNVLEAWKFFEVNHPTWSTLDSSLGHFEECRCVGHTHHRY
jgi:hypothetical protein